MIQIQAMCYYALCYGTMGPLVSLHLVQNHLYRIVLKKRLSLMASNSVFYPQERSNMFLKILLLNEE